MAPLPSKTYYRAGSLGEGSFGSVVCVYDDDGNEYAAKIFDGDEDDEDEGGIDVGTLREVSMLRVLNGRQWRRVLCPVTRLATHMTPLCPLSGVHPHLMPLVDITELEEQICMIMPKMAGDLSHAIKGKGLSNKDKVRVAALSLNALSFLHSYGILHRDIKPDNILLNQEGEPVLADFSLAKVVGVEAGTAEVEAPKPPSDSKKGKKRGRGGEEETTKGPALHTAGAGTPTYTAPEIVGGDEYGCKADVWSMGVVLYEMFTGTELPVVKDKQAFSLIEDAKAKMSGAPPAPLASPRSRATAHHLPTPPARARRQADPSAAEADARGRPVQARDRRRGA